MTYLVIFEDQSHGIQRADLLAALERDWPSVAIQQRQGVQESRDIVWTFTEAGQELEGYTHRDGTCMYLDSSLGLAARFVLWFRGLVPTDIELFFCDDSYTFNGSIDSGMSLEDVAAIALEE
ncbi:hypothetical protein [Streptomyces sp. G-G2]|uniref:hypothetical protein n=1 Tax=Streptomyces sp. G-G2 TaxID=3046201 RepID=UPI0024BB1412|nr:hypothetical protein [Streptomyces sp. G-G2]MDJ0383205.1 hypothetical protein [Streptomyces sp. G-G2]